VFDITIIGGQGNGAGFGLGAIEEEAEVGALDGLLNPRIQNKRHGVVALDLVIKALVVHEFGFGAVLGLEGKTDGVLAKVDLSLLGVTDVDGIGVLFPRDGLEVKDVVLGGVRPDAEVQEHRLTLGVQGLDLELSTVAVVVVADGHLDGQIHLDVLIETSNVALVIPRSDEADLGSSLGRVDKVDFSGSVNLVGDIKLLVRVAGELRASLGVDLTGGEEKSGGLEGVDEGQTHGGRESKSDLVLVVELGVVEVLAVPQDRGSKADILGQALNGGVVEGEEALSTNHVEENVAFDLVIIIGLNVKHLSDLFGAEGVLADILGRLPALALLALVLLVRGARVAVIVIVVLVIKLIKKVINAGNHGTKLRKE
jgi:hypothetical protein